MDPKDKFGLGKRPVRRAGPGNDPDLGSKFEARFRGERPMEPGVPGASSGSIGALPPASPYGDQMWQWAQFLSPKTAINWYFNEVLHDTTADTEDVQVILTERVKKGQVLVIIEWTPLLLQHSVTDNLLLEEVPGERFAGQPAGAGSELSPIIGAELLVDGRSRIGSRIQWIDNSGETQAVNGVRFMNRRAFVTDPTFPVTMYVEPTSTLTLQFKYTTDVASLITDHNLVVGGRILGFYISTQAFSKIQKQIG